MTTQRNPIPVHSSNLVNWFIDPRVDIEDKIDCIINRADADLRWDYGVCIDRAKLTIAAAHVRIAEAEEQERYEQCAGWNAFILAYCAAFRYGIQRFAEFRLSDFHVLDQTHERLTKQRLAVME